MAIKYQVFVSSTYEDLKAEREQVVKAVLEMGHIPVGMEMFSAADEEQWKIISRQIDETDYYILILAHRYGSTTSDGVSYTEKEYDYAAKRGVPILGFVLDDSAPWPAERMEKEESKRASLASFKVKVRKKLISFWSNLDELHGKSSIALMKAINTSPRVGWTRADEIAGPEVTKELTRLSAENARLRNQISNLEEEARASEEDAAGEIVQILKRNTTQVHIYGRTAKDWGTPIPTTLFDIFKAIAPNLMVENTTKEIAGDIALTFGSDYRTYWPVPSNIVSHWLSDFSALELVVPSSKKHSVNDKDEYWCLSDLGKQIHAQLRRIGLEGGVYTYEAPEELDHGDSAPDS
ncbi:MAG TPA: DUF4062 domain-containing protein [Solimonas sp.]|nr:DUF4062 domain-containing protein [Solimonas sp.]